MARTGNPYYADSGKYRAINQGLNNLGQMFMASQDPNRRASAMASAWDARANQERVQDMTDTRAGRSAIGDLFAGYDPEGGDFSGMVQQILAQGTGSGAMGADDLGTLFRVAAGNLRGVSDDQRAGAVIGSGDILRPDDGVSISDREGIATRNASNAQALRGVQEQAAMERLLQEQEHEQATGANERPPSRDNTLADIFLNEGPEAAEAARVALYGPDGGGAAPNVWLEATRRANVEEVADAELNNILADAGVDPGDLPVNLRAQVLEQAIRGVEQGQSPRLAVSQAWTQMGIEVDPGRSGFLGIGRRDPAFNMPGSPRQQPAPAPQSGLTAEEMAAEPPAINFTPSSQVQMPDGRLVPYADVESTARSRGLSVDDVIRRLVEEAGGQIIPGS